MTPEEIRELANDIYWEEPFDHATVASLLEQFANLKEAVINSTSKSPKYHKDIEAGQ